eukprot:21375_1
MMGQQESFPSIKPSVTASKQNYIGKTNDIHLELQRIAKKYGKNYTSLMKRDIIPIINNNANKVESNESECKTNDDTSISFTLMQFNVLADGLSSAHSPSDKSFKNHIRESLPFEYRGFRLIEEIIRFKPDIVTAQEVDQIDFFNHYLSPFGYKSVYCAKPRSKCVRIGVQNNIELPPDGSAVFWNSNVFEAIETYQFGTHVDKTAPKGIGNGVVAAVHLKHKTDENKQFIVASTHLKAFLNLPGEVKRIAQLMYLLPNLRKLCERNKDIPLFIGTDFNSVAVDMLNPFEKNVPFFPYAYQSVVNGKCLVDKLNEVVENKQTKNANNEQKETDGTLNVGQRSIEGFEYVFEETKTIVDLLNTLGYEVDYGLKLQSAYCYGAYAGKELGHDPTFTSTLGGLCCLDYIFFQPHKDIEVTHLLSTPQLPTKNETMVIMTPRWDYPSDHFSLMATFKLLKSYL